MSATETHTADHPAAAHPAGRPATAGADTRMYRLVHHALRASAHRFATAVEGMTIADARRGRALARWWDGFSGELHCHHRIEDDLLFPALAARVASYEGDHAPAIAEAHHRLEQLLDAIDRAVVGLGRSDLHDVARARVLPAARDLAALLDDHLGHEDRHVIPLFERYFTAEEYAEVDGKAIAYITLRQLMFTGPWLASHMPPAEAAELLAEAPLPVRVIIRARRRPYARLERAAFAGVLPPNRAA